ncbi:hypothetical protein HPB50_007019 [Hyalomma asiaticum]|uniref:Uncharacterized protein n=1 Tax=Hyalomma asiaticum TaxID=266040 RepID=A0ACB7TFH3_HYAAI|nr:hypothetical protein HPB50_007019 [Hyalomma asiaticum]
MEEARRQVAHIAYYVTIFSYVVSLSLSWRIWRARSSQGVPFLPLGAKIVASYLWLLCGIEDGDPGMVVLNGTCLVLTTVNAAVHQVYSDSIEPGHLLIGALATITCATSSMTVMELAQVAAACTSFSDVAPVARLRTYPLVEIAACDLIVRGFWAAYAMLSGDEQTLARNIPGAALSIVELNVAIWCGTMTV